jgi:hypothetical protein
VVCALATLFSEEFRDPSNYVIKQLLAILADRPGIKSTAVITPLIRVFLIRSPRDARKAILNE